jgi:hypothetical protein
MRGLWGAHHRVVIRERERERKSWITDRNGQNTSRITKTKTKRANVKRAKQNGKSETGENETANLKRRCTLQDYTPEIRK